MRMYLQLLLCLSILGACADWKLVDDGGTSSSDIKCPSPPDLDLSLPAAKCVAAKGLSGDNLFCIDFASISDQSLSNPPPAKLAGWDFVTNCGGMNWEVAAGKLQIKNFGQFASTCGLTLPGVNLNDADKQKYQRVTLSIIQRVDINNPNQTAQAALGSTLPNRTFWSTTGKTEHQQLMISMARSDAVPMAASQTYQYLLQLTSGGMYSGLQGWQIDSIAVNASP